MTEMKVKDLTVSSYHHPTTSFNSRTNHIYIYILTAFIHNKFL